MGGNRGFGFVRFERMRDAESVERLKVYVHDKLVDLEIAVAPRKGGRDASAAGRGPAFDDGYGCGYPTNGVYGCGYGMVPCKGFGPAMGKGMPAYGVGKMGPYGVKGAKGYW